MSRGIFCHLVLAAAFLISGCHREPASTPDSTPKKESSSGSVQKLLADPGAAPPPAPVAPGAAPAQPDTSAAGSSEPAASNDPQKILNTAIDYYVLHENRPPKTMQDLMEGGQLKAVPPAPPGMKWTIDRPTLKAKLVKQ